MMKRTKFDMYRNLLSFLILCNLSGIIVAQKNSSFEMFDNNNKRDNIGLYAVFNLRKCVAVISLSPVCPICYNELYELKQLSDEFGVKDSVEIILCFPENFAKEEIRKFLSENKVRYAYWSVVPNQLLNNLGFTVTPQVKVYNEGKLVYSGRISNAYESISVKRTVVTQHYLYNAIKSVFNPNIQLQEKETIPVGCFISTK